MKKYLKHFLWLFIVLAVLFVAFVVTSIGSQQTEGVTYTRTNTECATEERVFDYADKLTDSQEDSLRELIAQKEAEVGCDILLLTIDDERLTDLMTVADDFYDNNKFGYNAPWGDGVIYVDNWATGDVWLSTSGRVETRYSSSMIDRLINRVCAKVNDNPYEAYVIYVNQIAADMSSTGSVEAPPASYAFFVAMIVTAIYLTFNLIQSKGKKTTVANTYVAGGRPLMRRNEDIFMHKHVTQHHIDTSSGGGGGGGGHHISSGGHSHGGGGGHH